MDSQCECEKNIVLIRDLVHLLQLLSADTYASYSQGVTAAAARDLPAFEASLYLSIYIYIYLSISTSNKGLTRARRARLSISLHPIHLHLYPYL